MQVQIRGGLVDFTGVGAVLFAGGSIAWVEQGLRGVDDTVPQVIRGVFLWNLLLEVCDFAWVRQDFAVSQPRNAAVFYLDGPFGAEGGSLCSLPVR